MVTHYQSPRSRRQREQDREFQELYGHLSRSVERRYRRQFAADTPQRNGRVQDWRDAMRSELRDAGIL